MTSTDQDEIDNLIPWAIANSECENFGGEVKDQTQRKIDALESYALLGLRERRAGDRAAYRFYVSGTMPNKALRDLLDVLPHVSQEMQQKLTKQLVDEGLVALSALLCEVFLHSGTKSKPLVETCATCLHYLGFSKRALHVLQRTNMIGRDRTILATAVGIHTDQEDYDAARKLIASSGFDEATRRILLSKVDAVEQTTDGLSRLTQGAEQGVFVVNLLQDINRRHAVTARLSSLGIPNVIVKAVSIDDIPEHLLPLLRTDTKHVLDGSFGNQLSQYGVWKTIATGETCYGVVLEDDAFVRYSGLARLPFNELASAADIIFLNDRLAPSMASNANGHIEVDSLEDVVIRASFGSPDNAALGSDGYVLSRNGAQKLERIAMAEGFHTVGTDWYIVCHAFDYRRIDELNPASTMARVLRTWESRVQKLGADRLSGAVLKPALVEHRPLGTWRNNRAYF